VYSIPENLFFEKIDESKRTPKPPTKATLLSLADKIEGKPKQTRKKEESKSEPSIDKKDEKDESMFDEVIEEVEFESTVLLNEIEDPASVLLDSLNALIDYEKTVGIEVFNRELSETPGIVNTISFFIRALSPVIQEAIDILLEPQD